jgi:hypothetical protein
MTQETISDVKARAYVYHGDWVADCPTGDNGTEHMFRPTQPGAPRTQRVDFFHCSYCGHQAFIDWPDNWLDISQVLAQRPHPDNRNWYPKDHPVAVRHRIPHGQSVRDLLAENEEHGVN